jgi:hypothetical protein
MASFKINDLVNHHLDAEIALTSFEQDLSEEQLNLCGGFSTTADGEPILARDIVIVIFPKPRGKR